MTTMNDEEKSEEQLVTEIKKHRKLYSELEGHMADFNLMKPENKPVQDALKFLSPLLMELLNLTTVEDIYDFVQEKLQELVKDAYIIISTYDEPSESLKIRDMIGITPRMLELAKTLIGVETKDFNLPQDTLDEKSKNLMSSGKLKQLDEGLYYISGGRLSREKYGLIEEAFGVDETYVMGFSFKGQLFGSVIIVTKKGGKPLNISTVETILNIFSAVLQNKIAEKEVKKREKLLSLVTDNMLNVVGQIDAEGTFQYISPSIKTVLGYEPREILGESVFKLINLTHPQDQIKVSSTFMESTVSYLPGGVQHRFKHANGHYLWLESLGNPLFDEKGQYQGVVFSMTNIDSVKVAEENLRTSLQEKELLLRELHHRVKNNMQIISSLLNLQSAHVQEEESKEILKVSQSRVKSMAMIHDKLYTSHDLSHINFKQYTEKLVSDIFYTYKVQIGTIEPVLKVEDIEFNMETAIPLGLIINELVTNSLKFAFPDTDKGSITVKLETEGQFVLTVADDGIGLPPDFDLNKTHSLGLRLVNSLVIQLDGEISMDSSQGAEYKITFRELDYSGRF